MNTDKKILISISSKSPNKILIDCIESLYKFGPSNQYSNTKIVIIDSDSDNFDVYNTIKSNYSLIDIILCKNKNYEHGAWKHTYFLYPDYDIYMCIQDSIIITQTIDVSIIDNNNAYTFHNNTGYNKHLCIKSCGINLLRDTGLSYHTIIDSDFTLAQHSCFIVNNTVMKDILKTFIHLPINKEGSNCTERNFGLYFILNNIKTYDLQNYFTKICGNRR